MFYMITYHIVWILTAELIIYMDVDYHTILFIIFTATYYLLYWLMTSQSRS
jgi:hypothetical protein